MRTVALVYALVLLALAILGTIATVGRARKPLSNGAAVVAVTLNALLAWAVIYLASV